MNARRAPIVATVHVVTTAHYVGGDRPELHTFHTGHRMPWNVARRATVAHRIGLEYVRSIGRDGDVLAVTVSDGGRRALASWRRMTGWHGFTGTHDVHPLVSAAMTARETFGAYLARRTAAAS